MSRTFILPYRGGSKTVRALGIELEVPAIRMTTSKYVARSSDLVINWGNSSPNVDISNATVLNDPSRVGFVSNKLNFFKMVSDYDVEDKPRVPSWTQDKSEVEGWLESGSFVFARTKLTGHSGEGIVEIDPNENYDLSVFRNNTLFVKYIRKKSEFRVHFFKGEVFDVQRKARVLDREEVNYRVRSHDNGFIYSRNNIESVPEDVILQVNKTIPLVGLDFGAVDVIYNQLYDKAYILEVNTAPGLEGTTLEKYCEKFREVIS